MMQLQECALHPNECNKWTFTGGSLSLALLVRKDRETWELLGVAVKGK
jgi:hypothetical protein